MVGRPSAAFELAESRAVSGGISAARNPTIASRRLIRSSVTETSMAFVEPEHFVYCQSMKAMSGADLVVSRIAAAIGEPARTRMLLSLIDGRARTSTELAMLAEVTPSTASVHLNHLREEKLVMVSPQGRLDTIASKGAAWAACSKDSVSRGVGPANLSYRIPWSRCARRVPAMTIWPEPLPLRSTIISCERNGYSQIPKVVHTPTMSAARAQRSWHRSESMSPRPGSFGADSPTDALTGASAGRTSLAHWVPRFSSMPWPESGSTGRSTAGSLQSPDSASEKSVRGWA